MRIAPRSGLLIAAATALVFLAALLPDAVSASTAAKPRLPGHHRPHRVREPRHHPVRTLGGRSANQHARANGRVPTGTALRRLLDPGVTIADFLFTPGTITIHVGDTITWSNNGPSSHTATADNGSFNTGVLKKGQTASVTFNTAGTFNYHCSIHPFMHGAVVVLAAAKTSSSGTSTHSGAASSGSKGSGGTAPTSAASGQGTLPLTGANVLAIVLGGLVLMGAGLLLRRFPTMSAWASRKSRSSSS